MKTLPLPVSKNIALRLLAGVKFGDCWLWHGATSKFGHGRIKIGHKLYSPHRLAYRNFVGEFDERLLVCHTCDVPNCIRPSHLFAGSSSENMTDCRDKGRLNLVRGVDHPHAILTEEDVIEIRNIRRRDGWGKHRIARELGLTTTAVEGVIRGTSWKHLTDQTEVNK